MAPAYRYGAAWQNPYAPSIAELLSRAGDIQARGITDAAAAQAQGAQASGTAWSGAAQNIGQTLSAIPQQLQKQKTAALDNALKSQELDSRQVALDAAKRQQSGQRAIAGLMSGGDTQKPGDVGPQKESYLDGSGLFDVKKITAALGSMGLGDQSAELVKGAEGINDSILKHQELEQKAAQQHTVLLGDMAAGVSKMVKLGTPIADAMDFVSGPALATKRVTPEEYAQVKQQILALPPDQQQQALSTLMDQAAQIGGGKNVGKDTTEVDRYGRVIASNMVPEKPTRASLAADLSSPDEAVRNRAKVAIAALRPPTPVVKRTEAEQEYDAYAKSIGKTSAEDLSYEDRQTFAKNAADIKNSAAFKQHMAERQYDNAHPAPEKAKNQDALEQEYRTVLARGLSSRSGGLGLEDSKVQTANHLTALLDQSYDPKTDTYNIPKVQQTELALGLARMMSPNGTVGIQLEKEINQATAAGDLNKAITYVTGTPQNGSTQDVVKMFRDSILRQGSVAEQNREGEMAYLRNLAPTALDEGRRSQLESVGLNPLRQSRVIKNTQTGERKLQISTDGGKTWK